MCTPKKAAHKIGEKKTTTTPRNELKCLICLKSEWSTCYWKRNDATQHTIVDGTVLVSDLCAKLCEFF